MASNIRELCIFVMSMEAKSPLLETIRYRIIPKGTLIGGSVITMIREAITCLERLRFLIGFERVYGREEI